MRQLPDVIALNDKFGGLDDFAIVTVSLDRTKTIDRMHEVIEEFGITYPVLHQFVDGRPWAFDYSIRYIPKSVLIDPMGNIWGDFRVNDDFPEILEFLLAQDEGYLPVILSADLYYHPGLQFDGEEKPDKFFIGIEAYSPNHFSEEVKVDLYKVKGNGDEELIQWKSSSLSVTPQVFQLPNYGAFGFSNYTIGFSEDFTDLEDMVSIRYVLELVMPGSEHLNGGKGLVILKSGQRDF